MTFNNLNDLFKKIENDIQDTMRNEVADTVKANMAEAIQTSVYSVYSPEYYNRRMNNGGLSDTHNMEVTEIQNGVSVHNAAPLDNGRNDYDFDDIIVNRGVLGYPHGRDFYSETVEELSDNKEHMQVLKDGMKKRGYSCK